MRLSYLFLSCSVPPKQKAALTVTYTFLMTNQTKQPYPCPYKLNPHAPSAAYYNIYPLH